MKKVYLILLVCLLILSCNRTATYLKLGESQQADFLYEIPAEFTWDYFFLEANINGVKGKFILDTGAPNVFSYDFAKKAGIEGKFKDKVSDASNQKQQLEFAKVASIKLGDYEVKNSACILADFSAIKPLQCFKIDGLLGANVMRYDHWQIDMMGEKLRISDDLEKLGVSSTADTIEFYPKTQGTPRFHLQVGDQKVNYMTFDTGKRGGIDINKQRYPNLPAQDSLLQWGTISYSLYGKQTDTVQIKQADTLRVGSLVLTDEIYALEKGSNLMGNSVWKRYRITFDYQENNIYIDQYKPEEKDLQQSTLGVNWEFVDNHLEIGNIYENKPANRANLQLGDKLLEVNGKSLRSISQPQYCEYLLHGFSDSDEAIYNLTLSRGDSLIRVTLEKEPLFSN